jgi:hypothetical protein
MIGLFDQVGLWRFMLGSAIDAGKVSYAVVRAWCG